MGTRGHMPKKVINALSAKSVLHAKPGRHADGGGLHLLVKPTGARSWVFRYTIKGKSRDLGLSRCPEALSLLQQSGDDDLSLAQARDIAAIYRLKVRAGIDPLYERKKERELATENARQAEKQSVTFKLAAAAYLENREDSWRNAKHRQQWHNTLKTYVYPVVGDLVVSEIQTHHVLSILEPIWSEKHETASRIRGRIEAILDAAKVRGHRQGENPARWRGHLDKILPMRQRLARGHHSALPYSQIPQFFQTLYGRRAVSALALEFTILTAARSGEVLGATWGEVDLDGRVWNIPAVRTKAGKPHRVPLADRAAEILEETRQLGREFLFPGPRGGRMSPMTMAMLLRRMKLEATVHGFRSGFRDWAAEQTGYPHEVCEMALAHSVTNKSEAAYRRGDLFDKRCHLMKDWADFCWGIRSTNDASNDRSNP